MGRGLSVAAWCGVVGACTPGGGDDEVVVVPDVVETGDSAIVADTSSLTWPTSGVIHSGNAFGGNTPVNGSEDGCVRFRCSEGQEPIGIGASWDEGLPVSVVRPLATPEDPFDGLQLCHRGRAGGTWSFDLRCAVVETEHIVVRAEQTVEGPGPVCARAMCPEGTAVVGGGGAVRGLSWTASRAVSEPGQQGWMTCGFQFATETDVVSSMALCVASVGVLPVQETITLEGEEGCATATCPDGALGLSVGMSISPSMTWLGSRIHMTEGSVCAAGAPGDRVTVETRCLEP